MAVIQNHTKENYALYNGDSCQILPLLPDASVDLSIYSPPFSELYNYSSADEDLSNCATYEEFLTHYEFIVEQMARLTKPGRMNAVHCMELALGNWGVRDFPGDILRLHQKHGFTYGGRYLIRKEPFAVRLRTMTKTLTHKNIVENSTDTAPAGPDYVLVLRRNGDAQEPVTHKQGMTDYAGEIDPDARLKLGLAPIGEQYFSFRGREDVEPRENKWSHWVWRQYADTVWTDIRPGNLLPYQDTKEEDTEKHICPLQLDTIDRVVELYSNPGDVVLTPFLGVGSEAYCAVKKGRRAIGIELKETYYKQAIKNLSGIGEESIEELDMFGPVVQ